MEDAHTHMTRASITLPAELAADARRLDLNISRLCRQSIASEVARLKAERWAEENADAIAEYNADIRGRGMLLQDQGPW